MNGKTYVILQATKIHKKIGNLRISQFQNKNERKFPFDLEDAIIKLDLRTFQRKEFAKRRFESIISNKCAICGNKKQKETNVIFNLT